MCVCVCVLREAAAEICIRSIPLLKKRVTRHFYPLYSPLSVCVVIGSLLFWMNFHQMLVTSV